MIPCEPTEKKLEHVINIWSRQGLLLLTYLSPFHSLSSRFTFMRALPLSLSLSFYECFCSTPPSLSLFLPLFMFVLFPFPLVLLSAVSFYFLPGPGQENMSFGLFVMFFLLSVFGLSLFFFAFFFMFSSFLISFSCHPKCCSLVSSTSVMSLSLSLWLLALPDSLPSEAQHHTIHDRSA